MKLRAVLLVAACSAVFVSPAAAQDAVRVTFNSGRVTITADNATVSDILREWTRVGGSSFINADKISATERLTLRLENEPELRAIDVLLRPFAGYAVIQRPSGSTAISAVGRVVIMPGARPAEYPVASAMPAPSAPPAFNDFKQNARTQLDELARGVRPQPDDDGAVRQAVPPPAPAIPGAAAPIGQASPLGNTTTQTGPVFGTTTSSRPGVVIGGQPVQPRPGGRSGLTPIQPKPAGGGG